VHGPAVVREVTAPFSAQPAGERPGRAGVPPGLVAGPFWPAAAQAG
jgi:hypothetical protein